ncbi:hypothetical protein L1987_79314 [Smallanthus sonchifolius]|uniref:Uncharacterized protein n=1 Tax=Smallanthus sonchifolius TaxID=185202 RepID=A0ACB8ZET9_9ASTR|nr:hypothetical protein L1987_79314 [Smallanthus sonchifolius]
MEGRYNSDILARIDDALAYLVGGTTGRYFRVSVMGSVQGIDVVNINDDLYGGTRKGKNIKQVFRILGALVRTDWSKTHPNPNMEIAPATLSSHDRIGHAAAVNAPDSI